VTPISKLFEIFESLWLEKSNFVVLIIFYGGMAEWSKAADLRSVGQSPREFEPRFLHFLQFFFFGSSSATVD
jgi:hypothetical protein